MTVNMATRKTLAERRLESQLRITRGNMRRQLSAGALSPNFEQMKANETRLKGLLREARAQRRGTTVKAPKRYVVTIEVRLDVEAYADTKAMAIAMARENLEGVLDPSDFYILPEPSFAAELDTDR